MCLSRRSIAFIILLGTIIIFVGCLDKTESNGTHISSVKDCIACDRLTLFNNVKDIVSKFTWTGLSGSSFVPPLIYFTDSTTYIAFSDEKMFAELKRQSINCNKKLTIQRLEQRIDDQPFYMENKMSFNDSLSPYYYAPAMLCSDVETMRQFVPDFTTTEEWLQLVMHEYFHSFQFSHHKTINYLADTIRIAADTLDKIYLNNNQFQQEIKHENQLLIKAYETDSRDSIIWYVKEFQAQRESRRSNFQDTLDFDLSKHENFWETIEGTARYVEYYMAMHFEDIPLHGSHRCDRLFNDFKGYSNPDSLENRKEFKQRTVIMPAYYYVTGFNICRLMDKLGFEYKSYLFDNPSTGLYQLLINASR